MKIWPRRGRRQRRPRPANDYKLQGASDTERQTQGGTSSQVTNAEAQLSSAQAALVQAQAQYEHQNADTSRTVALAAQGIMSYQSRDEAATALQCRAGRGRLRQGECRRRAKHR